MNSFVDANPEFLALSFLILVSISAVLGIVYIFTKKKSNKKIEKEVQKAIKLAKETGIPVIVATQQPKIAKTIEAKIIGKVKIKDDNLPELTLDKLTAEDFASYLGICDDGDYEIGAGRPCPPELLKRELEKYNKKDSK